MAQLDVSPEILEALQKLSALLDSEDALNSTLQTIVDLSVATLPGCDAAGVTVRVKGQDRTAAASDDYTLEIDNIQYDLSQGPCVQALETQESVHVESIADDDRWTEFRRRAADKGLRSSLSQPLSADGFKGALNLYSKNEKAFDDPMFHVSELFAKQASIALQNAQTYVAARRLSEQLNEALLSRDLIGQAKGILMERESVTDQEAFDMLRRISQNQNIKLRDVAQQVVKGKR